MKVRLIDQKGQERVIEGSRCELEFTRTYTERLRIPVDGKTEVETLEDTIWNDWVDLYERYGVDPVPNFPELDLVAVVVDGKRYKVTRVVRISED